MNRSCALHVLPLSIRLGETQVHRSIDTPNLGDCLCAMLHLRLPCCGTCPSRVKALRPPPLPSNNCIPALTRPRTPTLVDPSPPRPLSTRFPLFWRQPVVQFMPACVTRRSSAISIVRTVTHRLPPTGRLTNPRPQTTMRHPRWSPVYRPGLVTVYRKRPALVPPRLTRPPSAHTPVPAPTSLPSLRPVHPSAGVHRSPSLRSNLTPSLTRVQTPST